MADDSDLFRINDNDPLFQIPILPDFFAPQVSQPRGPPPPSNNEPILISSGSSGDNNQQNPIRPGSLSNLVTGSSSNRQLNDDASSDLLSNTNQNQQVQRQPLNYSRGGSRIADDLIADLSAANDRLAAASDRLAVASDQLAAHQTYRSLLRNAQQPRPIYPNRNAQPSQVADSAQNSSQASRRYADPNVMDYQWSSGPATNHQFVSIPFQSNQINYTPYQQPEPPQQQAASQDNQLGRHQQNNSRLQQQPVNTQHFRDIQPPSLNRTSDATAFSSSFLPPPANQYPQMFQVPNTVFSNMRAIPGFWDMSVPQSLFNHRIIRNRRSRTRRVNHVVDAYERRRGDQFLRGFSRPPATIDLTDEVSYPSPMTKQEIKKSIEARPETNQDIKFLEAKSCSVCLASWKEILLDEKYLVFLRCGHVFCRDCAKQFSTTGRRECPNCRKTLLNVKPAFRRLHIPLDPRLKAEKEAVVSKLFHQASSNPLE